MGRCYFWFFFVFGLTMPYFSPVLIDLGYSKAETGLILGAFYLCSAVAPIVGGRVSDRYLRADLTLRLCAFGMAAFAVLFWILADKPSWPFLAALIGYTLVRGPAIPLQDALAMQEAGGDPKRYSRMRVLGSLGFVVSVTLFGHLAESYGYRIFFPVVVAGCAVFALQSLWLPRERKIAPTRADSGFWRSLSPSWWGWLLAMMCHWFSFGPYHYGFTLLLAEQGIPSSWHGWFWSAGVAAEIAVFLGSGWFFRRFPYRALLFAAFAANLIRWTATGLYPQPWALAALQIFHGLGFALFYAAALKGIADYCGGVNRASYQGLFSTCVGGLASIGGTAVAGALHEIMPLREAHLWFLPAQTVAIVLLALFPLRRRLEPATHTGAA